jgi:hypothetical protein
MSILSNFIDLSISLSALGKHWMAALCSDLCEAGRTVSYVETVGNKADTVHNYTKLSDERSLKRAFELPLRKALKRFGLSRVELAIDTKKDLYYGKELFHTRRAKHERGTDNTWEYVQLSIVWPIRVPLMAIPYPIGAELAELTIELLEFAKRLPITITKVLFDRGFYNWKLIDYLESANEGKPLPYLIFVPKNDAIKRFIAATEEKLGVFHHKGKHTKEKSTWKPKTTIVVCKEAGFDRKGEPYDMVFATNLKPRFSLIRDYKRRWNIETGFRVMEEGRIKTKSNHPLVRFFYFLLRGLLTLLWVLSNATKTEYTYKAYLAAVEKELRKGMVLKPPPITPVY